MVPTSSKLERNAHSLDAQSAMPRQEENQLGWYAMLKREWWLLTLIIIWCLLFYHAPPPPSYEAIMTSWVFLGCCMLAAVSFLATLFQLFDPRSDTADQPGPSWSAWRLLRWTLFEMAIYPGRAMLSVCLVGFFFTIAVLNMLSFGLMAFFLHLQALVAMPSRKPLRSETSRTYPALWLTVLSSLEQLSHCLPMRDIFTNQSIRPLVDRLNSKFYTPLRDPWEDIRLVEISPGARDDQVHCTLLQGLRLRDASYEALSYVWLDTGVPRLIKLDGRTFRVTHGLHQALRSLRSERHCRVFWIDAICINQYDQLERGVQVQQMQKIYSRARTVVVFLGSASLHTAELDECIRRTNQSGAETAAALCSAGSAALDAIVMSSWWRRTWVIQEAVAAREIVVMIGRVEFSWEALSDFLGSYQNYNGQSDSWRSANATFSQISGLRSSESDMGLEELLVAFRHHEASEQVDKVYALMGLVTKQVASLVRSVDYRTNSSHVFRGLAKAWITHHGSLYLLIYAEDEHAIQSTWCPTWSIRDMSKKRIPLGRTYELRRLDASTIKAPSFSAAGGSRFRGSLHSRHPACISLSGFTVDVIEKVGSIADSSSTAYDTGHYWEQLLCSWEALAGIPAHFDASKDQVAFHKTIMAGAPLGQNGWRQWPHKLAGSYRWDRVEEVCNHRRFFITATGTMGLAPSEARLGDLLVVLLGSDVPFILREAGKGSLRQRFEAWRVGRHYKLVGHAYAEGLMHYEGNIEHDIEAGRLSLEDYELW